MRRLLLAPLAACLLVGCGGTRTVHTPHQGLGPDPKLIGTEATGLAKIVETVPEQTAYGGEFTAEHTGTLQKIELFTNSEANGATTLRVAVATARTVEEGEPELSGPVVEEVARTFTPGTSGWQVVEGLSVSVVSGTKYWLWVEPTGGNLHFNYAEEAGKRTNYHRTPATTIKGMESAECGTAKTPCIGGESNEIQEKGSTVKSGEYVFSIKGQGVEPEAKGQLVMMP